LVVEPGQPDGHPLDGHLELRVLVDEVLEPLGEPGERDLLLAAPLSQLLEAPVGEIHSASPPTTWTRATSRRRLRPARPAPPRAPSRTRPRGRRRSGGRPGGAGSRRAAAPAGTAP